MRACFLGPNVCALGYGVAMVQTLPEDSKAPVPPEAQPEAKVDTKDIPPPPNPMFMALKRRPHYT